MRRTRVSSGMLDEAQSRARRRLLCVWTVLTFAWVSCADPVVKGLYFSQRMAGCWNPPAFLLDSRLFYRVPLSEKEGGLWERTRIEAGVRNMWSPTDDLVLACLTVEPIGFFEIGFMAGGYAMFRGLGVGFFPLEGPEVAFDAETRRSIEAENRTGWWVRVEPVLKARVGPVVLVDAVQFNVFDLGGDEWFVEMRSYSIHNTRDRDVLNNAFVFYSPVERFMTGPTYQVLYTESTGAAAHRLRWATVYKPSIAWLRESWAAVNIGICNSDEEFRGKFHIGALVGGEVQLSR